MKDLQRKTEKFIRSKASSAKKNYPASPHLTYKVTNIPPNSALASTKSNSRTFSMTVTFFNPRFDNPYPKEFAIRHESTQMKTVANVPDRMKSPKRDPILQNNDEPIKEERPTIRCFSPSTATLNTGDNERVLFDRKAKGEFNHVHSARSSSPKIEGIRTYAPFLRDPSTDNLRRQLKDVRGSQKNLFNPITEGDPKGVKLVKERTAPPISEQTKKINDRMTILGSDRGTSPRGRVFWDTNNVLLNTCPTDRETEQRLKEIKTKIVSPKFNKSDGMKQLIGYDFSLPFKDQGVAGKCTNVPFSERLKAADDE